MFNHNGPPALWLVLSTDQLNVRTDENWEVSFAGSSWRNAALASAAKTPGRGNPVADGERTFDAAKKIWPLWILLIGIACGGVILWRASLKQFTSPSLERVVLLLISAMWLFLFWNNTRLLPFHAGFDSKEHLKYIDYIQQHWSLPSPTEGWEMYQPPLYYFIAASILSFCKLSINDPGSVVVLRALGAFFGIAQCVLVFLSLRLLLPARTALVGSPAGGFSTNAFVSDALCDERTSHRHARDVDGLSLLASAQERNAARRTICLCWIGTGRDDADKGDRHPLTSHCNRCDLRKAYPHASAVCNLVAQSRSAHRNLSRGVRLVLRAHMAEVRNSVARQLGRHQRIHLVAGSRLSHSSRLPPFRTFVNNSAVQRVRRICGWHLFDLMGRRLCGGASSLNFAWHQHRWSQVICGRWFRQR